LTELTQEPVVAYNGIEPIAAAAGLVGRCGLQAAGTVAVTVSYA